MGDAESSLGDAESSLGDAESSLGDAEQVAPQAAAAKQLLATPAAGVAAEALTRRVVAVEAAMAELRRQVAATFTPLRFSGHQLHCTVSGASNNW
jgi:hypothetical protein